MFTDSEPQMWLSENRAYYIHIHIYIYITYIYIHYIYIYIYHYIYISLYIYIYHYISNGKNGKCHREMMINHEIRRVLSLFVETTPYRLAAYITPFIPIEHPWYPDLHDIFRNRSCQKHLLYPLFKKGIDHVKNMLDPLKKHPDLYSSCCYTCRMPLRSCLKLGQLVFQRLNLSSCARFSSDWML